MEEKIYEFDPQVYPMKLWVMKKPDFETVQKDILLNGRGR